MKQLPFKQSDYLIPGSADQMLRKYRVSVCRIAIGIAGTRVKRDPHELITQPVLKVCKPLGRNQFVTGKPKTEDAQILICIEPSAYGRQLSLGHVD
jgi:hypothetical protein